MPRTLLSGIIGFFSFFAFFLGGAFLEVPGKNSIQEIVAGCIAVILYIMLGQFLLPRDPDADTAEDWRVRACMAAPLVPIALLILVTERQSTFLWQAVPMLAAGCIGVLLGGILARSLTRSTPADAARAAGMSRLPGNTAAAFYVGVSVILFALVPALKGTSRGGTMVVAVLHVVLAAAVLRRIRKGKAPIFAAMFGFLMTMLLAGIGASYMAHGPAMRLASIAHFVCAPMDMVVCGCCVGVVPAPGRAAIPRRPSMSAQPCSTYGAPLLSPPDFTPANSERCTGPGSAKPKSPSAVYRADFCPPNPGLTYFSENRAPTPVNCQKLTLFRNRRAACGCGSALRRATLVGADCGRMRSARGFHEGPD